MSISRRGMLAAGLTAVVVGSIGVVSIMNANAEDTTAPQVVSQTDTPAASSPSADATQPPADASQPPADATQPSADATQPPADATQPPAHLDGATAPGVLPWGDRPQELTQAPAGSTATQVRALGADIAPEDNSGDPTPQPEWAPKGRYNRNGSILEETTSIQPPQPPVAGALAEPVNTDNPVNFFYGVGSQVAASDGAYANVVIGKPYLASGDYHTLAEISVQSADGSQVVEVGWNVDRTVNGDSDPHLFVYHWVNGQQSCYNGCGWRQYSQTTQPGYTLPSGTVKLFGIQHANGAWWVAYDTEWIGYFPDWLWSGQYTRSGLQQFFGEVATSTDVPCSQMGNGSDAFTDTAARFGSITLINGPATQVTTRQLGGYFNVNQLSDRTFRYGGPGGC